MTKEQAIQLISGLYPVDSQYEDTREIGEKLLLQAKINQCYSDNWRDLPDRVLIEYARLCEEKERMEMFSDMVYSYKF